MAKVVRTVVCDGDYCLVEYAVTTDRREPAKEFLDHLESGMVEVADITNPDEKQPSYKAKLLGAIFDFAEGEEIPRHFYNFLSDGIWEFKAGDMRVSFYDTDGEGGFEPKNWRRDSPFAQAQLPEDFDEFVRLGHCFAKPERNPAASDLAECATVRTEDLDHDRA